LKHQKSIHYGFDHYNLVENPIFCVNFLLMSYFLVREEISLAKFEEILEQERRHYVEKGIFLTNFFNLIC
jgi:hypothetical protein